LKVIGILTSCNREVVAKLLKELSTEQAVEALGYVKYSWQYEVMYFVDKTTYHNLAPNLLSMLVYSGPTGPFGPEIGNWAPAYAGLGFDVSWSGMKGFNNVIENYGDNSKVNVLKGLGAFIGFRTKGHNFLELHYQNRSVGTDYQNVAFSDSKFSQHTIGVNFLKGGAVDNAMFQFNSGWGLHANFANWSTSTGGTKTKVGTGINGGLSWNAQLFINPFKKVPVLFGLRGYAQLNFPTHDFNSLADALSGTTGSDLKDNKSIIATYGMQFQAMYKFGKKKDDREFTDFNTEMVANVDPHINTTYTEILPVISPDGKTLYFIRSDHPQNNIGSMNSQDVWVADVSDGLKNSTAKRMNPPLNTQRYNMIAGVSPDGNSMMIKGVFDSDGTLLKRGYSMIYRTKDGWTEPKACNIDSYDDMSVGDYTGGYWTQDGKHIIMSFSESEGNSDQSLYVTHLEDNGDWTKPKMLNSTVNGDGDNHSPFLASDGKTLYFSSNRDGTLGSNDIWMTKKEGDGWDKWSEPVNLGEEINSESWDVYY